MTTIIYLTERYCDIITGITSAVHEWVCHSSRVKLTVPVTTRSLMSCPAGNDQSNALVHSKSCSVLVSEENEVIIVPCW
jgi:hypothetical protein